MPDKLRRWAKWHAENKSFTNIQDVNRYYRDFTAQATCLITSHQISENEANILFFRGIPKAQQKTIRRRLPADKTKVQSPLSRDDVLVLLQKEFDEDDIANNTDTSSDSDDNLNNTESENSDSDDEPPVKALCKAKKKVKFSTKKVPTASTFDPTTPTSAIETLAKQMQELQLGQSRQIQELQQSQVNIL